MEFFGTYNVLEVGNLEIFSALNRKNYFGFMIIHRMSNSVVFVSVNCHSESEFLLSTLLNRV